MLSAIRVNPGSTGLFSHNLVDHTLLESVSPVTHFASRRAAAKSMRSQEIALLHAVSHTFARSVDYVRLRSAVLSPFYMSFQYTPIQNYETLYDDD